ncbi:binary toxin-like calcium binding domain-containing protein [Agaribacterium haliotis]|uniref:binary toxin-like calcium binding domain-containing protein n=1 Tax=Agaribacterium haliotis TaxID=2013869 RepID=UPI000BB57EB6|nr:binary toxin-like calcium binding domain-containing protein [Agaribacterium haliotis]
MKSYFRARRALPLVLSSALAAASPGAVANSELSKVPPLSTFAAVVADADMDGIADGDESLVMALGQPNSRLANSAKARSYIAANKFESTVKRVSAAQDSDGDGISDFLETYGYTVQDNQIVGLRRQLSDADWQAFKSRDAVDGYAVFQFAAKAFEDNLLIRKHPFDQSQWLIKLAESHQALRAQFLAEGIAENSRLIVGTTHEQGSIASILFELVNDYAIYQERDSNGNTLPVFYSHPLLASSDRDPYTDRQEVLGLIQADVLERPYNHPLVAALPSIRANLLGYRFTLQNETRITHGEMDTEQTVTKQTESYAHSHGFAVTVGAEKSLGTETGTTVKFEVSTNHQWTYGSSVTEELRVAHSTYSHNTDVSTAACFSKLQLKLALENVGSASISDISPKFNIYIGDTLWNTVSITSDETLLPGMQSDEFTILGQAGDESCLSLEETNYLQQGGLLGINTSVNNGRFSYFDNDAGILVENGSWDSYAPFIPDQLARIDLSITDDAGVHHEKSFHSVVHSEHYPNIGLSSLDVLNKAYQQLDCNDSNLNDALYCFGSGNNILSLNDTSIVTFSFSNRQGQLLDTVASQNAYDNMPGALQALPPLEKQLVARSIVSIIDRANEKPDIAHIEAINILSAPTTNTAQNNPTQNNVLIRSTVRDYFGVAKVEFCLNADKTSCQAMQSSISAAEYPQSAIYELRLSDYELSGSEVIRASNIVGNSSELSPETFYLTVNQGLEQSLVKKANTLAEHSRNIQRLSNLRKNDAKLYQHIVDGAKLMLSPEQAREKLNRLSDALAAARQSCGLDVSSQLSGEQLKQKNHECYLQLTQLEQLIASTAVGVFNYNKLPISRLKRSDHGWSSDDSSGNLKSCKLAGNSFVVGIGVGKKKNRPKGTAIEFKYRSVDQYGKLSAVKNKDCGYDTGIERRFAAPWTSKDIDAKRVNVVLDVGLSANKGNYDKLCVKYRMYDFDKGEFIGKAITNCNGHNTDDASTEKRTGDLNSDYDTRMLRSFAAYSRNNDVKIVKGEHISFSRPYDHKLPNNLIAGQEYKIINVASKQALTLSGNEINSRSITLANDSGLDSQIWKVEAVNDREFRLIPSQYDAFTIKQNNRIIAVKKDEQDEMSVDYQQHWKLSWLKPGIYAMLDAQENKALTAQVLNFSNYNARTNQQWQFIPVGPIDLGTAKQQTLCAEENQTCYFTGKQRVAYGDKQNNKFNYKNATNSIACNKQTFGDPSKGKAKACFLTGAIQ